MTELKERFSLADEIGTRELWGEARRRAAAPEAPPRAVDWPPAPGHRLAAAAVALAVFATAAVFAWETFQGDVRPQAGPAVERPPVDLAAELPEGWSELPAPPQVRSDAATAWTGSQLLVWGGYEYVGSTEDPDADGFAFDTAARRWESLPPSPLEGRSSPAFAWTGRELLIWGGWDGGFRDPPYFGDGAAFDPVAGTWRMLPPAPIVARAAFSVWTGKEFVVWGSTERAARRRDGAAYDPATNRWRTIAEGPLDITDGSAVWTGQEMIVFGAALDGNNHAETATDIGAAYDPISDSWRRIADSTLSPQAATAAWPGSGEMIAWDYEQATAAYDARSDSWRDLRSVPVPFSECYPKSVAIPGHVFGDFCGRSVTFSVAEDRWREITRDELRGWLIEPVAAGSAFLTMGHSLELSGEPGVTFDTRMWAYVPKAANRTGEVTNIEPFVPSTEAVGNDVRMPVVFPDGTRATLVHPIQLDLARFGIQPEVSYLWRDDPPPRFPVVFLHDPHASLSEFVDGTEPVGRVDSDPNVEIWRMSHEWSNRRDLLQGHWLRYRLSSWTVLVALEGPEQAEKIAASLVIREAEAAFPVVKASGPIALSHESGEGEGPMLAIGTTLDPSILLWLERCEGTGAVEGSGTYGSACLAGGQVSANIYGDRATVEAIVEGLRLEDFRPA